LTKPNNLYALTENTIFGQYVEQYVKKCKRIEATKEQIKDAFAQMVEDFY